MKYKLENNEILTHKGHVYSAGESVEVTESEAAKYRKVYQERQAKAKRSQAAKEASQLKEFTGTAEQPAEAEVKVETKKQKPEVFNV